MDELTRLLTVARDRRERDWIILLSAYLHALRVSEVIALTRDNIQGEQLYVERLKGSLTTVQPLLTNENPLFSERDALLALAAKAIEKQRFFPLTRQRVGQLMKEYGKAAGIPPYKLHPHALKHTCCAHLVEKNLPIAVIREWAGHRSLSSTGFYTRLSSDAVAAAVVGALS